MSFHDDARSDAQDTARNFIDEIVESFFDNNGEASNDLLNDYSDSYHHENHVDKSYSLIEAAELLDELDEYEETDEGLWQGLKPRDAISCQAAYTYGNAVYSLFQDLIKEINEDSDICDLYHRLDTIEDEVQDEWNEAEETHKAEQAEAEEDWNKTEHDEPFEPAVFEEPFDIDDEIEDRKEKIKAETKARMEEIIDNFS